MNELMSGVMFTAIAVLFVLAIGLTILVVKLWIDIGAMKGSTHKIQYIDPLKAMEIEDDFDFEQPDKETKEEGIPEDQGNIV